MRASTSNNNTALGSSAVITNGVLDLTIQEDLGGVDAQTVEQKITVALGTAPYQITSATYSHVSYIVPDSVDFSFGSPFGEAAGYAYLQWYLSSFQAQFQSDLAITLHEIGHVCLIRGIVALINNHVQTSHM